MYFCWIHSYVSKKKKAAGEKLHLKFCRWSRPLATERTNDWIVEKPRSWFTHRSIDAHRSPDTIDQSVASWQAGAIVDDTASSGAHASLAEVRVSPLRGANSHPHFVHHCVKWIGWRKKVIEPALTCHRFHAEPVFPFLFICLFIYPFILFPRCRPAKRSLSHERTSIIPCHYFHEHMVRHSCYKIVEHPTKLKILILVYA